MLYRGVAFPKRLRVLLLLAAGVPLGCALLVALCYWKVEHVSRGRVFRRAADAPAHEYALVLGTSRLGPSGWENLFFKHRIEAAVQLYEAGRVQRLLVSGDNRRRNYDEPTDMKEALMARGIPEAAIVLDYAGFRTLDSVYRAQSVFGQRQLLIISQPFHARRALVIADHFGLEAAAFGARDVSGQSGLKVWVREIFARVKLMLDLYVLRTRPHFEK